jgi:hypothetical protein
MQTPLSVISHLLMAMVMLQQQTIIPFIMQQQEHIPPAIMVQRFWIMVADIASSLMQVIFMPPAHFSILMVQRGTIIMFGEVGVVEGEPIVPMPVVPMPIRFVRSIIIAPFIGFLPRVDGSSRTAVAASTRGPNIDQLPSEVKKRSRKYVNSNMTLLPKILIIPGRVRMGRRIVRLGDEA